MFLASSLPIEQCKTKFNNHGKTQNYFRMSSIAG
jgi:hypothetical protein